MFETIRDAMSCEESGSSTAARPTTDRRHTVIATHFIVVVISQTFNIGEYTTVSILVLYLVSIAVIAKSLTILLLNSCCVCHSEILPFFVQSMDIDTQ